MRSFPVLFLVGLAGCRFHEAPEKSTGTVPDSAETAGEPAALVDHVLVLVLDGVRMSESFGRGVSDVNGWQTEEVLPEIRRRVLPDGALMFEGLATGLTITIPGHCDLLTGIRNELGHFPTPVGPGAYRPTWPTLFEAIGPDQALLSGNSDHMESLDRSVYPGSADGSGATYALMGSPGEPERPEPHDERVIEEVRARLEADPPKLMVVNLHAMDLAGHTADDPTTYLSNTRAIDDDVADLWEWIQSPESGLADHTALVLVADHGRHEWGDEEAERLGGLPSPGYRHHGDQCWGCRKIPMFIAAPGVIAPGTVSGVHTLEDLGRTLAYLLGVDLPYASGVVIRDAFEEPVEVEDRSGPFAVDASGETVATWSWLDEGGHRSVIEVDGRAVSHRSAFAAEAPRVLEGRNATYACWREFAVLDQATIDWPWVPVCEARAGGAWTDLAFPVEMVSPLWRPALALDAERRLVVAWVDNAKGTTATERRTFLKVYRWSADAGWEFTGARGVGSAFPGEPSLQVRGGAAWVAWPASDMSPDGRSNEPGRYTRHIVVSRVGLGDDGLQSQKTVWRNYTSCPDGVVCPEATPTVDAEGKTLLRSELPAISATDDLLRVAWVGWDDDGSHLLYVQSGDGGDTWTTPTRLDGGGRVFGHIGPRIERGTVYWGRLSPEGEAELCRYDGALSCTGLGSPRLSSFAVAGNRVLATVDTGEGAWAVEEVAW